MKTLACLGSALLALVQAVGADSDQPLVLPESPPWVYTVYYHLSGPGGPNGLRRSDKLSSEATQEIRTLLATHLKKLDRPLSSYYPNSKGRPPFQRQVDIRDTAGIACMGQILLLPDAVTYRGLYITKDKKVVERFRVLLAPPSTSPDSGVAVKTNPPPVIRKIQSQPEPKPKAP